MPRSLFFISIWLLLSYIAESLNTTRKVVSINGNDIDAFRAKYYIPPINGLADLNQKSEDVIGVVEKLKELDKKGFEIIHSVPDNDATCSIQVKYTIKAIITQAKKQCNCCIVSKLDNVNRLELNADQKECALDVLKTAKKEVEKMSVPAEICRLTP